VPGVYSEAVTIFVTGAIFDGMILHPYLPYVTYLDGKCAQIHFVGAAIKHSAYSAKHAVFIEWTALYGVCTVPDMLP
jgi:hypothetical protein